MSALPPGLMATPSLDRWIRFADEGVVLAYTGKAEIGQGLLTALRTIVAEELDVRPERVRMVSAHTGRTPNEGTTAGSMSIETSGANLRQASAWARRLLLMRAADRLGVAAEALTVRDGEVSAPGVNERLDYWQLADDRPFEFEMRSRAPEKPPAEYEWVGRTGQRRVDIAEKATLGAFVHDVRAELHARVVRPPSLHHRLSGFAPDTRPVPPGELVVDGSFVAVAHPNEHEAVRLAERVTRKARWERLPSRLPGVEIDTRRDEAQSLPLRDGVPTKAERRVLSATQRARYSRPFLMHGSLGPSAATARSSRDGGLVIESASQGVEALRATLARAFAMDAAQIEVRHAAGAGCYGHNGADDAAFDAALVARAIPGRKVLLKWTREEEHGFEPLGPPMLLELAAELRRGRVQAWSHDVFGFTHVARPSPRAAGIDFLSARFLGTPLAPSPARPALGAEVGMHRNALPIYAFPDLEVTKHFIADAPVRTSALRGLGAQGNVFAIESFMDELAHAAGVAPDEFRRRHLRGHDARALAVLDAALAACGGLAGSRGLGLARYKNRQCCAAVVAEVDVDDATAQIRVPRLWIAADAGRVVDPDGLRNQLEGGAVQALSWCLKEAVEFDADGAVANRDWDSYPILRFDEVPEIETVLIDHPELAPVGAGEATVGPTSGSLANAVFAATGLRVRDLPMTPARLRAVAAL